MDDGFELFNREDEKTAEGRKKRRRKGFYSDGAEMTPEEYFVKTMHMSETIKIILLVCVLAVSCVTMLFVIKTYNADLQNNADTIEAIKDIGDDGISVFDKLGVTTTVQAETQQSSQAHSGTLININTADKETLMQLSGIGDVKAQAIIDYRFENGAFQSVDELLYVDGIGEKTLEKFRDEITVG